ncbi:hypothetical protein [uncultured Sphaerochaeta sp.]|uniref:hypothetical protein n=1 Tax=uncultured Sphaerochaeta sp. TaxID=886478 RepID=UPI002A0A953C|nr:hypothetical protein [uncultured Sphaerochaeta sp.]
MPKILEQIKLWSGLQIIWRGRKVYLISAIQEDDGSFTVHYQDKIGTMIVFDVAVDELKRSKVIEG